MININIKSTALVLFWFIASLTGCSWTDDNFQIYKTDRVQGNILNQEQVNQLKPGMTKQQVRFLLGTPLVMDSFTKNRWDYVYFFSSAEGERTHKRLTLYFQDNALKSLTGTIVPQ